MPDNPANPVDPPLASLSPRQRREKMVNDARQDTQDLIRALQKQRAEGLVKRRWYEVLKANFG